MLRLTELAHLVVPVLAYIAWRVVGGGRPLPRAAVAAASFALVVLALALGWFGAARVLPRNEPYVPAHLGANARIVGPEAPR